MAGRRPGRGGRLPRRLPGGTWAPGWTLTGGWTPRSSGVSARPRGRSRIGHTVVNWLEKSSSTLVRERRAERRNPMASAPTQTSPRPGTRAHAEDATDRTATKGRMLGIDVLRALAILGMVWLHFTLNRLGEPRAGREARRFHVDLDQRSARYSLAGDLLPAGRGNGRDVDRRYVRTPRLGAGPRLEAGGGPCGNAVRTGTGAGRARRMGHPDPALLRPVAVAPASPVVAAGQDPAGHHRCTGGGLPGVQDRLPITQERAGGSSRAWTRARPRNSW